MSRPYWCWTILGESSNGARAEDGSQGSIELPIDNVSESSSHLVDRIVDDLEGLGVEGLSQRAWNVIARRIEQMN